ncbi:MAG: hypothetical protein AAGD22_11885 [Verrucomicrobiota bacterium]
MSDDFNLPMRQGPGPRTTDRLPHSQLTQHGPDDIIEKLHHWCFALPGVLNEASGISVPGARALVLKDSIPGNPEAFMTGREFAHIHPPPDTGSMHVKIPSDMASEVVKSGWGEEHYLVSQGHLPAGLVLLYSPRDDEELKIIQLVVTQAYEFAVGQLSDRSF